MLLIIRKRADEETINKVSQDLNGYVKVAIDIKRGILAAGGTLHVDGEKLMLEDGSRQADLWGGGIDFETGEIDFDSMINIRPAQGNRAREVLDKKIREQMEEIIHRLLK
ncbi:MAG: DUF5674 family protein [Candidatus Omnitrophica bacterium]|nr:DUF5674 family protein [Candidatus Omnitrophota bacterium]